MFAQYALDLQSVFPPGRNAHTVHGVIESQPAFFVGAKNHAAPKLLVKIADRNVKTVLFELHKTVGNALAFKPLGISEDGVLVILVADAGAEPALGVGKGGKALPAEFVFWVVLACGI